MSLDFLFSTGTFLAMLGWLLLLASPLLPSWTRTVPHLAIPALIGIAYVALVLANWSGAEGGFSTLDDVATLFQTREILLAGWLHKHAFDLFVGSWEVTAARDARMPFWLVVPCLALTFLFGPAGFVLFLALRAVSSRRTSPTVLEGTSR